MTDALTFRDMRDGDCERLIALWQACGLTRPWNEPHKDIAFARQGPSSTIIIGELGGHLVGSIMVGHDGHRGTFYYVAVDPAHRRKGYGRALVGAGEAWLKARGVWKVNLLIRQENGEAGNFYRALGYELNEVFSMGRRILMAAGDQRDRLK